MFDISYTYIVYNMEIVTENNVRV